MRSWSAFVSLPFPDGCAGLETEGVCLVSLDTFAAGCVDTFVANRGCLDPNRIAVLEQSAADLSRVLPKLEGDARAYFNRLNDMVVAVLHECRRWGLGAALLEVGILSETRELVTPSGKIIQPNHNRLLWRELRCSQNWVFSQSPRLTLGVLGDMVRFFRVHMGSAMHFVLQPWQFFFVILVGWVHRDQQEIIQFYQARLDAVMKAQGKKRLPLTDEASGKVAEFERSSRAVSLEY